MKNVIKLIGALFIGVAAGLVISVAVIVMFTDMTLTEFIGKLFSVNIFKALSAGLVGIVAALLSYAILIPVHEAGHLICGLLSGYKFVSFRIFNITFIKVNGKIRIKKFAIAGTGGQCLLTPPDLPLENIPTAWYNAGGIVANILLLLIALPLFLLNLNPFVCEALVIFCLIDIFIILINGIPMKLAGVGNDGYNMLYLRRNMLSKKAMLIQLRTNALVQEGMRPKDMPAEWFDSPTDINYKNPLEVSIPLMHASRLVDEMKWNEAYQEWEALYSHKKEIMPLYVNEIACELAFCAMITGRTERARELLDAKLRKYINDYKTVMSTKQRILCGIAMYIDNNSAEAQAIYRSLEADKDKYLLRGEVKSDLAIMGRMLSYTS